MTAQQPKTSKFQSLRTQLASSDTAKAGALAVATLAGNAISLLFTVIFARLLKGDGYSSLGALLSTFWILAVPGTALQGAIARETASGHLGRRERLATTLSHWTTSLICVCGILIVSRLFLRNYLAAAIGVDDVWAAAATLPTAGCWLLLSMQRGALQGIHAYKPAGLSIFFEALGRLIFGLILVAFGTGVTGAYLGTPLSMLIVAIVLGYVLRKRVGPPTKGHARQTLRKLIANERVPVAAFTLLAVLQNIDVIIAKHQFSGELANAYVATSVAAKAVIWVAIGVGLYLLPEATRRAKAGENAQPVFVRTLAIISAVALPCLLVYAAFPRLVLELAFGARFTIGASALLPLACGMTLLAVSYLTVQYMLALRRISFLYILAAVAFLEPLLLSFGKAGLGRFALIVLAAQSVAALGILALQRRTKPSAGQPGELPAQTSV